MRNPDLFAVMLEVLVGTIIVYCIVVGIIIPAWGGLIRLLGPVLGG